MRAGFASRISIQEQLRNVKVPTHPGVPQGPPAPQHSGYIDTCTCPEIYLSAPPERKRMLLIHWFTMYAELSQSKGNQSSLRLCLA